MAVVGFKTDFSSISDHVIITWHLNSNPLAEVGRVGVVWPNVDGQVTTIGDLTTATYIFRFYTSSDGTTLDTLFEEWPVDVKDSNNLLERIYYTVDGGGTNPVSGTSLFFEPYLEGKEFILFHQGTGHRDPGDQYTVQLDGGWDLSNGEKFKAGDKWLVMVVNEITNATSTITTDYAGINVVTESEDFGDDYKSKHNIASFGSDVTTTFPDLALIADCKAKFSTFGMAANYWNFQFSTGNEVSINGKTYNSFALRKDEYMEIVIIGGAAYITDYKGDIHKVGVPYYSTKQEINTLFCNGAEYDINDYQPLIDELPTEMIVSYSDWALTTTVTVGNITKTYSKNKGKFAVDNVAGTFKVPDLRGQSFRTLKNFDSTSDSTMLSQKAGGMWAQELIQHNHDLHTTGASNLGDPGKGIPRSKTNGDGPDAGAGTHEYVYEVGGTEQRIDSTGFYAVVKY